MGNNLNPLHGGPCEVKAHLHMQCLCIFTTIILIVSAITDKFEWSVLERTRYPPFDIGIFMFFYFLLLFPMSFLGVKIYFGRRCDAAASSLILNIILWFNFGIYTALGFFTAGLVTIPAKDQIKKAFKHCRNKRKLRDIVRRLNDTHEGASIRVIRGLISLWGTGYADQVPEDVLLRLSNLVLLSHLTQTVTPSSPDLLKSCLTCSTPILNQESIYRHHLNLLDSRAYFVFHADCYIRNREVEGRNCLELLRGLEGRVNKVLD